MEKCKNILEMQLENNCTPWQTAEGDHETWIILRKRINLAPKEIKEIHGACTSYLKWAVVSKNLTGSICKGNIGLAVNYDLNEYSPEAKASLSVGDEENILQDYLREDIRLAPEKIKNDSEEHTASFTSIVIKEPNKTDPVCVEERVIELPWQAFIYSEEEILEPRIMLIHLFMEGISTILVEVLLKLENKKAELQKQLNPKKNLHFPHDEGIAVITGDKMQEAIALISKRSFKSIDCGPTGSILHVKAINKYTLIYLSSNKGGPRIQMASCFKDEERKFKPADLPPYQPAEQRYCLLSSALTKVDQQRAAYKKELILDIIDDLPAYTEKAPVIEAAKTVINDPLQRIANSRKRPGEKWLRQGINQSKGLNKNRSVICIKLREERKNNIHVK